MEVADKEASGAGFEEEEVGNIVDEVVGILGLASASHDRVDPVRGPTQDAQFIGQLKKHSKALLYPFSVALTK